MILVFALFGSLSAFGQEKSDEGEGQEDWTSIHIIEPAPIYKGGWEKIFEVLRNNACYPPEAREKKIEGRVYVQFKIAENGTVHDVKVKRGLGYGCDEEAVRLVSLLNDWIPVTDERYLGKNQCVIPVIFSL